MSQRFFDRPILSSPYEYPRRHWKLFDGQPTNEIVERRRPAEFITPFPKPKKRRRGQLEIVHDEGKGLSSEKQRFNPAPYVNELRQHVDAWRGLPNPNDWLVTPETARLLHHWRRHRFSDIRPFFCQLKAVETAIWLTEVAPRSADQADQPWT